MNDFLKFKVSIKSPLKSLDFLEVENVIMDTADGQLEFLSEHTNLANYLVVGMCRIFTLEKEIVFDLFKVSIFFDSEKNILNLFCLDFKESVEKVFNFDQILESFKNVDESSSQFKLSFIDEMKIVSEREVEE